MTRLAEMFHQRGQRRDLIACVQSHPADEV